MGVTATDGAQLDEQYDQVTSDQSTVILYGA